MSQDPFLEEAVSLGDELAATAVWSRARCNWLYSHKESVNGAGMTRALDPSLHTGTAGVAVFLARLARYSADPEHVRVARAAMRQSLKNAWYVDPRDDNSALKTGDQWRYGFYLGIGGIAWAANEVGRLVGDDVLTQEGERLVRRLLEEKAPVRETDLMFGAAGGVCAMLGLARHGVRGAEELGTRLADVLVNAAHVEEDRMSWGPYPANPGMRNYTGFSHGAAGVAYALAAHYGRHGDEKHRRAALAGFAYERHLYMEEEGNWPDYSKPADADGHHHGRLSWCHGAPGIGLSRALSYPILKDDLLRDDAEKALATTNAHLEYALTRPTETFMLCCGTGGVCECALETELGLGRRDALARARAIGRFTLERYGRAAREGWDGWVHWPTGTLKGNYPALIQGTSGIGTWLLHLHKPAENPSVLVPGASAVAA